ncbi:MAG: lytic transglycosylase domain-containing protein [Chitinophagales bacterium]|nr:lytic transglycosylase domain-containing protein [Chitinophagales bacterium]MDW8417837.1 lytic transglycosylase domain-containing protein [Chitinophagales bacterium]
MLRKKSGLFAALLLALAAGVTCAAIFYRSESTVHNIFNTSVNEAPGIEWINPVDTQPPYRPVSIRGELYFAGERVPLEDPDVRERLERELQLNIYWHSNTLMAMKNANRWFPEIEKILREQGVPTDFKYLALIESGFRHEVSPAGAVGFWQIMRETGKAYGLQIDGEVDERYHSEKACIAACKILKKAYEELGNWTIAAAAYNLGLASMKARCADQKTNNFYEMYFNPETSRYIFRILAMKIIFNYPEKAGFRIEPEDLYQPYSYEVVYVDTTIPSIADFAANYGLKYKHIKLLNPWLRDAKLTNKERKKYAIRILKTS